MTAMAPMSAGLALFLGAVFVERKGFKPWARSFVSLIQRSKDLRYFAVFSLAVFGTILLSLLGVLFFPVQYHGETPLVHVRDVAKAGYVFLPFFWVLALHRISEDQRRQWVDSWILGFLFLGGIAIVQFFTGWPRPQDIPGMPGYFHATLFIGHHLSVASLFIFPFFATLEILRRRILGQKVLSRLPVPVLVAAAVLGCGLLFLTFSRAVWVSLPVGIFLWFAISLKERKWRLLSLAVILGVSTFAVQLPAIHSRIESTIGWGPRFELWETNWEFFKVRPLTGVGFRKNHDLAGPFLMDKYPERQSFFAGHAHNNFLDQLAGTGAFGTVAWLLWCGMILVLAWKERQSALSFTLGLFTALVVFHLNGLTQLNFWDAKVQHELMAMVGWILYFRTQKIGSA